MFVVSFVTQRDGEKEFLPRNDIVSLLPQTIVSIVAVAVTDFKAIVEKTCAEQNFDERRCDFAKKLVVIIAIMTPICTCLCCVRLFRAIYCLLLYTNICFRSFQSCCVACAFLYTRKVEQELAPATYMRFDAANANAEVGMNDFPPVDVYTSVERCQYSRVIVVKSTQ